MIPDALHGDIQSQGNGRQRNRSGEESRSMQLTSADQAGTPPQPTPEMSLLRKATSHISF
jgi:hypothetical protein